MAYVRIDGLVFSGNLPATDNYYNITHSHSVFLIAHNTIKVTARYIHTDSDNIRVEILNGSMLEHATLKLIGDNGTTRDYEATATFHNAGHSSFSVRVIDNNPESATYNNVIGTYVGEAAMIPWSPVTIYAYTETAITTSGTVTIHYEGSCDQIALNQYTQAPDAFNDLGTVTCKYRLVEGPTDEWTTVLTYYDYGVGAPVYEETKYGYKGQFSLTGLEYNKEYVFHFEVSDACSTATYDLYTVGEAIFDWCREDFRFNIPVVCNNHLRLRTDRGITAEGKELLAYKTDGNLYLGYDSYSNEDGITYICGDNIVFLTNGAFSIGDVDIFGLKRALENTHTLATSISNVSVDGSSAGYFVSSNGSCTCALRGNSLYVRYRMTFSTAVTASETNVFAGRVIVQHGGRITGADYVSSPNISGAVGGLQIKNISIDDEKIIFEVYICNLAASTNIIMGTFNMPVTIDLAKY